MDVADPSVVEVKDTRMRDGRLEGLCAMSDGSEQWREPSAVTVEAVNDRTGEHAEIVDAKLR